VKHDGFQKTGKAGAAGINQQLQKKIEIGRRWAKENPTNVSIDFKKKHGFSCHCKVF